MDLELKITNFTPEKFIAMSLVGNYFISDLIRNIWNKNKNIYRLGSELHLNLESSDSLERLYSLPLMLFLEALSR